MWWEGVKKGCACGNRGFGCWDVEGESGLGLATGELWNHSWRKRLNLGFKKGSLVFLSRWVSANWNFMKNEASDNMGGHGAKNFGGGGVRLCGHAQRADFRLMWRK